MANLFDATFSLREMIIVVLLAGAILGWTCADLKTDAKIADKEYEFKQKLAEAEQKHKDWITKEENEAAVQHAKHFVIKIDFWHRAEPDGAITYFAQCQDRYQNIQVVLVPNKPAEIHYDTQLGMERYFPKFEALRATEKAEATTDTTKAE